MDTYRSTAPKRFYLGTHDHVLCLERSTGEVVWKTHLETGMGSSLVTLLVNEETIYVAGQALVACLDGTSGAVRWATGIEGLQCPASIALDVDEPGGQLVVSGLGTVSALDASTGALFWTNGLAGLGYHPICLRVPGALHAGVVSRVVSSGKSSRIEVLENTQ